MTALATPETSQVLIVNPLIQFIDQLTEERMATFQQGVVHLTTAASSASIPCLCAASTGQATIDQALSEPLDSRLVHFFRFDRRHSIWTNEELSNLMNSQNRPQLYICGFWLDDILAAAAIEAQTRAFDTHIITDLSPAHSDTDWHPFFDRIKQYGIVPICLTALLYEWMANTKDTERCATLEALWLKNKLNHHQGASVPRTGLS